MMNARFAPHPHIYFQTRSHPPFHFRPRLARPDTGQVAKPVKRLNHLRRGHGTCFGFEIQSQRKHGEFIKWRTVDRGFQIVKKWMPGLRTRRQIDFIAGRGFDSRLDRRFSVRNIADTRFRIRPRPETRLSGPDANLFTNLIRQISESQAADFSRLINPCQLANRPYPGGRIDRKAEMDRPIRLHRSDGAKSQTSLGDIHYYPAVIGRQAEVSEIIRRLSYGESAFVRHRRIVAPDF